jgi:hypothetical protein
VIDRRAVGQIAYKSLVPCALYEIGDPVRRPAERPFFPALGVRGAIEHLGQPVGARQPAEGRCSLRTQGALIDRAARVALNMNDLPVLGIDQLSAADRAIGADAGADGVGLSSRGWSRRDIVLCAASRVGSSPANCRGNDQSRTNPATRSATVCLNFMVRSFRSISRPRCGACAPHEQRGGSARCSRSGHDAGPALEAAGLAVRETRRAQG